MVHYESMTVLMLFLAAAWFFLPSYAANIAPVIAARMRFLPFLAIPVDGGRTISGTPMFGSNKTIRGFIVGVSAAGALSLVQRWLERDTLFSVIAVGSTLSPLVFGMILGFGGLLGDLLGSFLKRRLRYAPGEPWILVDQVDQIVGASLVVLPLQILSPSMFFAGLVVTALGGLLVNAIGVGTGIKAAW